ncbi:N-acetyltransferase [Clostridium sp. NSJ-6]|uniref:N-acetyltransferase n=1 Tax=Clostridium hominis TaxID=2763036 RepID=A0ABR7DCX1_9CLOT|nr:GNAT family N-acetyltransferase [Clostridium hominis]MBC5628970.1 N-acetyltransferase [Clostridium hominis]MDU2671969.1 GNAT family N-acetyltransferase [Clostridium sp.]
MGKVINIRKVDAGDANTLAYIQTESWKSAFNRILSKEDLDKYTDVNRAIELYNMLLSENIGNGFILTIDEKPHCIAYWDKTRDDEMEGYSEIICIHSLCDNWGKGYGTVMMNYILRDIKNAGFSKVMLWVFKENNRARKFYENQGFVLTEKSKKFSNAIEVMYCKDL